MNKKRIIFLVMIIICLIGICYGSYRVFTWKKDNDRIEEIKEVIEKSITKIEVDEEVKYSVDFENLKKINSDTVAYIIVNNTNIDYAVVQYKDNSYYLKHNFNKIKSNAGWVFVDYHDKLDGTDKNIVLYGHNMKNGSMFGSLKKVLYKDWYNNEENKYITFITEDGEYTYEVFSVYSIKVEDYYIKTKFKNDSEYSKFLKTIKNRSIKNFNVSLNTSDQILTLSTCNTGSSYRTVLHAKKINN